MNSQYLAQLNLPLDRGIYLDCGVLFPFYFKDAYDLNTTRWVGDICFWLKHFSVKTTLQVWKEARKAYIHVPLSRTEFKHIKPLYTKILDTIEVIDIYVEREEGSLSLADLSLLHRHEQDVPLLTADKALYRADDNAILLLWDSGKQQLSCQTDKVN